jgi:hypothetical protein
LFSKKDMMHLFLEPKTKQHLSMCDAWETPAFRLQQMLGANVCRLATNKMFVHMHFLHSTMLFFGKGFVIF